MIWIFVLAVGIAMTFTTLGVYSVWLKVFLACLKLALVVISVLSLAFLWKHIFRKAPAIRDGSIQG